MQIGLGRAIFRCMKTYMSFLGIMAEWPTAEDFAADHEVSLGLVAVWKTRNSIPAMYWDRTIRGAERRGIKTVTIEALAELARKRARSGGTWRVKRPKMSWVYDGEPSSP